MLQNPNWNKTENDVCLDDYIGWLETKDPEETYNFQDRCGACCIGQYMAARNIEWPAGPNAWHDVYRSVCDKIFGDDFFGYAAFKVLVGTNVSMSFIPKKFGDTLKSAKQLRGEIQ